MNEIFFLRGLISVMIRDFTMTFEILAWNSIKTKSYSIVPRLFYCLSGQLIAKKFLSGPVVKAAAIVNVFLVTCQSSLYGPIGFVYFCESRYLKKYMFVLCRLTLLS